jgi:hypothetical protein
MASIIPDGTAASATQRSTVPRPTGTSSPEGAASAETTSGRGERRTSHAHPAISAMSAA